MSATLYVVNPRKRKKAAKRKSAPRRKKAAAAAPKRRRRSSSSSAVKTRRYKRNPRFIGGLVKDVQAAILPAVIAGGGVLALDVALSKLPLPAMLKDGPVHHVTRAAAVIAGSVAIGMAGKKSLARDFLGNGLAIVAYSAARDGLNRVAPGIAGQLADLNESNLGLLEQDLGALVRDESLGALRPVESSLGSLAEPSQYV